MDTPQTTFPSTSFIETSYFTKQITEILTDDTYADLQSYLRQNPEIGDLIQGTGGVRKVRWKLSATGKSGGIRVIYYYVVQNNLIYMLSVYTKSDKVDLTQEEKAKLRLVIQAIKKVHEHG